MASHFGKAEGAILALTLSILAGLYIHHKMDKTPRCLNVQTEYVVQLDCTNMTPLGCQTFKQNKKYVTYCTEWTEGYVPDAGSPLLLPPVVVNSNDGPSSQDAP